MFPALQDSKEAGNDDEGAAGLRVFIEVKMKVVN